MKYNKVYSFYFSPAGTTAKVVNRVAEGIGKALDIPVPERRFTVPETRTPMEFEQGDIVVIGVPTYAGRVPNKIMPYIRDEVRGNGALAIPIVTFGNRAFDSSLDELRFLMEQNRFTVVAAGAFPSRHVFSDTLGEGNPSSDELESARDFGTAIAGKISECAKDANSLAITSIKEEDIKPYYTPLKEDGTPASFLKSSPKTDPVKCYMCGTCARACPMGVIDKNDFATITGPCIKCHACVKKCLAGAKYFDDPDLISHIKMLEENYCDPKEATLILE